VCNLKNLAPGLSKNTKIIYSLTSFGLADRIAKRYENKLFKIINTKKYAFWNSKYYEIVPSARLMKIVRKMIEELPDELGNFDYALTTYGDTISKDDLVVFREKKSKPSAVTETIALIETCNNAEKESSEFDKDIDQIVTQNGILNLKTGELRDHDASFLSTRIVSVPYEPEADCPSFLKFIDDITCQRADLAKYLQRVIGYCFTGSVKEQVAFIFHGFGSNGKSTLLNLLLKIADRYGIQTPAATLMARSTNSIPADLPRLRKAWFVVASEINQGQKFDEARLKVMTGGEPIVSRELYANYESYQPQFKVVLAVNILPDFTGCDYGISRRIRVVPFDKIFKDEDLDKDLNVKLEQELPGIFAWIARGAKDYFEEGLLKCEEVEDATRIYIEDMNRVQNFLMDECIIDRDNHKLRTALPDLWEMSNEWNRKNNSDPFKKKIFTNQLKSKGFKQGKSGSERQWLGIKPKVKGVEQ
jgi:putative DNA primase/helicase